MRSIRAAGASVYSTSARLIPFGSSPLGEKREGFLVVRLPVAAMDEGECWRLRIGGEKEIEPLARRLSVSKVEMPGALAPDSGAAGGPTDDDRIALRHRGGVVVGGVKLDAIHPAVEHQNLRLFARPALPT